MSITTLCVHLFIFSNIISSIYLCAHIRICICSITLTHTLHQSEWQEGPLCIASPESSQFIWSQIKEGHEDCSCICIFNFCIKKSERKKTLVQILFITDW